MNEYIILTTEGFTLAPNENVEIDNCQLLGLATGTDFSNALDNLLNQNLWIEEAGFTKSACFGVKVASGFSGREFRL